MWNIHAIVDEIDNHLDPTGIRDFYGPVNQDFYRLDAFLRSFQIGVEFRIDPKNNVVHNASGTRYAYQPGADRHHSA